MDIELYKTSDGVNVINKTLTDKIVVQGDLKVGFNTHSPTILLEAIEGVPMGEYNYLIIPSLGRNYFVEQVEPVAYKVYRLWCSVDVLETYKDDILDSTARYRREIRTGDYAKVVLDTSELTVVSKHDSDAEGFGDGESMIMTTVGG